VTSLNIQHLDSLNDAVEAVTGVAQRETVPDAVVASADRIDLLDVGHGVLRARIVKGGVFEHGVAESALTGYFSRENLAALRELALGWLEGRDLVDASARTPVGSLRSAPPPERVVAALTGEPEGEHVIRRAAQIAAATGGELIGLHVRTTTARVGGEPTWLERQHHRPVPELNLPRPARGAEHELTGLLGTSEVQHGGCDVDRRDLRVATTKRNDKALRSGPASDDTLRQRNDLSMHDPTLCAIAPVEHGLHTARR
jgi:two-component system sensor histidine kinase KdpD